MERILSYKEEQLDHPYNELLNEFGSVDMSNLSKPDRRAIPFGLAHALRRSWLYSMLRGLPAVRYFSYCL